MHLNLRHIFQVLTIAERKQFWLQILVNVFISIADIGALAFLLVVTDFYINNNSERLQFLPGWLLEPGSIMLIACFFILFATKNLVGIVASDAQFKFISKVAIRISGNKLNTYQLGDYSNFVNVDSSAQISRIAYYPFEFSQHVLAGLQTVIIQGVLILLTVLAIILYNAKLFLLLFFILFPPVILVFFFMRRKLSKTKKQILKTNEISHKYLFDALKGYVEGNIFQRNKFFHERFINSRKEFSKNLFNSLSIQQIPSRLIEIFAVLGLFILIAIAKWMGVNDSATLIMIGAFMAAAYKIIPGIVKIINAAGQMKAYEMALQISDHQIAASESIEKRGLIQTIEMKDISFNYDVNNVLSDFSCVINKGDFVGIKGQSGKGKTTIFNLLLGFLSPISGEIRINGIKVTSEHIKEFWSDISYVRQQPFFIYDNVVRNITLHDGPYDKERLKRAICISGLDTFIEQHAEGLDKIITENGKNISGGQQQRISIARALYKDASVFFLDEPFNELDEKSTSIMIEHLIKMAHSGCTILMITHDSKCLSYCDKIISLDDC